MTTHTTCIYCGTTSQCAFAKPEHVMPQAFGKFEHNFTLHRVCPDCNQAMGDQLEVFFGRDSAEAFQRLVFGLKPEQQAHQIGGKRVEFRVAEPGSHQGAYVRLSHNSEQGVVVTILPQVAFRHPARDEWVWLREFELDEESVAPYRRLTESRIFGTPDDMSRLMQRLQDLGVQTGDSVYQETANPHEQINIEVRATVDEIVLRTIAKIAFNYVSYITQSQPAFVLGPAFDPIRRYVRYGEAPQWRPVKGMRGKVLEDDTDEFKMTDGHIVTVDWRPDGPVISEVSLFNSLSYRVYLTNQPPAIVWWNLLSGHVFDTEHRIIREISATRRMLIQRP